MMDLSCVQTNSNEDDIKLLVETAKKYNGGHVSIMQTFITEVKELLKDRPDIKVIGNVSFPSGSDTITMKVAQAKEMIVEGCDEIDMVMNIGKLLSGKYDEVEADVRAVVDTIKSAELLIKIIIEISLLGEREVKKACEICLRCGATFVKTGTGWMSKGTTIEDVKLIKSIVGDAIKIKASGGNQPKVVVAKWLLADSQILLIDEPTRGIDVGAKEEIYELMYELKRQGHSLIVISSELPEIIRVSDRVAVMENGEIKGFISHDELSEEAIMKLAH